MARKKEISGWALTICLAPLALACIPLLAISCTPLPGEIHKPIQVSVETRRNNGTVESITLTIKLDINSVAVEIGDQAQAETLVNTLEQAIKDLNCAKSQLKLPKLAKKPEAEPEPAKVK